MVALPKAPSSKWQTRYFDEAKLRFELDFLFEHLLKPLNLLSPKESSTFHQECDHLAEQVAGFSQVFTHRDYHSRNIMVIKDHIGIIDFQDARIGPRSYDLVSLCFDSYVPLTMATRLELLEQGLERHKSITEEDWQSTLFQRQLKAMGSFGYLSLTMKKPKFSSYLKPAATILLELDQHFSNWPFISQTLLPRIAELSEESFLP